jgi:hypothetical protein
MGRCRQTQPGATRVNLVTRAAEHLGCPPFERFASSLDFAGWLDACATIQTAASEDRLSKVSSRRSPTADRLLARMSGSGGAAFAPSPTLQQWSTPLIETSGRSGAGD